MTIIVVVVVLLLLGAIAGAIVYFVKQRQKASVSVS